MNKYQHINFEFEEKGTMQLSKISLKDKIKFLINFEEDIKKFMRKERLRHQYTYQEIMKNN